MTFKGYGHEDFEAVSFAKRVQLDNMLFLNTIWKLYIRVQHIGVDHAVAPYMACY